MDRFPNLVRMKQLRNVKRMETNFDRVENFMRVFNQEVKDEVDWPDAETMELRIDLIEEELGELKDAILSADGTLVDVADALTDLLYVVYGAGHSFGIDLDKCFAEVHRSNMSKLGEDGKPIYREDGKVLKGKNFSEPNLKGIVSTAETDRKVWQQTVMEEHMENYNKEHGTSYEFDDYYNDVVNDKIKVHYDWKQLLGMENV